MNSWSYRLGMNYQATEKFNFQLGIVYDQTPQPDADVSPLLPDANRTGYSVGFGIKVGKHSAIEFSNLALFFHQRSTNGHSSLTPTVAEGSSPRLGAVRGRAGHCRSAGW